MGRLCQEVDFVNILYTHLTLREVGSNGFWNCNSLLTNVPSKIVEFVDQHHPHVTYNEERHVMCIWNYYKIRLIYL